LAHFSKVLPENPSSPEYQQEKHKTSTQFVFVQHFTRRPQVLKFPSIKKDHGDSWQHGPDVSVKAEHIVAVEPRSHSYHSFRPAQEYSVLHLATGAQIEVFVDAKVMERALAKCQSEIRRLAGEQGRSTISGAGSVETALAKYRREPIHVTDTSHPLAAAAIKWAEAFLATKGPLDIPAASAAQDAYIAARPQGVISESASEMATPINEMIDEPQTSGNSIAKTGGRV
jgi:hypothetical protein